MLPAYICVSCIVHQVPRHIPACGYLKLDLEKVERVYAEHSNYTCADPGDCVVLKNTKMQPASECTNGSMFYDVQASMFLELARLGKGMGGHPAVMHGYKPCKVGLMHVLTTSRDGV